MTRISQVRDELGAIGEKVDDVELVRVASNGFSQPSHDFVCAIVARENFPSWARLWDDFTQEELRSSCTSKGQHNAADEENVALSAKSKKKSKKDLSKVQCFVCSQYGHFASQRPEKKKKEEEEEDTIVAASAEVEDFARRFKKEFSLFSLISSVGRNGVVQNGTWYVDNGASRHMTGTWHIFCIISETGPDWFV